MLNLPKVIIVFISSFLNVPDYLNFRAVCLKTRSLPLNHLRLKFYSERVPPGEYDYIHYIGHNPEHLKNCIIRKLRLTSSIHFNLSGVYKLHLESTSRFWMLNGIKSVRVRNASIVSSCDKIKIFEGDECFGRDNPKIINIDPITVGLVNSDEKKKNLHLVFLRKTEYDNNLSEVNFSAYKKIKVFNSARGIQSSIYFPFASVTKKLLISKNLPQNIKDFIHLTFLELFNIKVTYLPSQLKTLKLNRCDLECNLPHSLEKLKLNRTSVDFNNLPLTLKRLKIISSFNPNFQIDRKKHYNIRLIIKKIYEKN